MPRFKRFGLTRRVHDNDSGRESEDHFHAAYLHYVARCKALGIDPMARDELRAVLSRAHADDETQPPPQ